MVDQNRAWAVPWERAPFSISLFLPLLPTAGAKKPTYVLIQVFAVRSLYYVLIQVFN